MKRYLLLIIFILSSLSVYSSWTTYQNDLGNTGIVNGNGYFPLRTANYSNVLYGMDFQPLAGDLNNDGFSEIVIFSNEFLKIFDSELNLIDEKKIGTVLGQPAIFNNKIIFNSRQKNNPSDHFFAYTFSDYKLNEEFNLTLNYDADFGGIKCLSLNGTDSCVFKDKMNYIHIVNLDSRTDSFYNTSIYNETRYIVPAIGDLDNDNSLDAVFWFDNNSNKQYGLIAFDLIQRKIKWIVDDFYASNAPGNYLKGQPVLADLNNDSKLEVAVSVYYDDNVISPMSNDVYTELFVFNNNGTQLFSKCEKNTVLDNGCNDATSEYNAWEGTNPFVLDINNSGRNYICFIKDKKLNGYFKNMAIECYNYSGNLVLDSELSPESSGVKTAIAADMNNDGIREIITESNIYLQNGTSLFSHDLNSNFAIPADVDGNGRLDIVWTKNGMTKLFVDDANDIKVFDVLISPKNPSVEDSLGCSWKVIGNSKIISANVSWYKNNIFYSSEIASCINSTLCRTSKNIPSSALKENDIWRCSVRAFENLKKSLPKSNLAVISSKNNQWADFSKNILSYGISPGNGYFSKNAINSLEYNSSGIDFQPMVADIDNDGRNEIVEFANNSLILLNKNLQIIAQKQVGSLRGQFDIANMDNDSFLEIAAVLNNSNKDNFTVFWFNGTDFKIKNSFDVTSQNGSQHIRCIDFDSDNIVECVFRDYNGIAHSYQLNATNQSDDELNVNISDADDNVYGSSLNIVPSFADFDNDGDLDGLFWFNDNFIVLDSKKNINLNVDVGTLKSDLFNEPALIGAKFVNLDRVGNYEIAVVYRNDYFDSPATRTEINFNLFKSDGSIVFSKLFNFFTAGSCSSPYNDKRCMGYASDIIVYDYDHDSYDDIGIYLEGAFDSAFGTWLKFFDRNGVEIASNKVEMQEGIGNAQSVTIADMNNDGNPEILLRNRIYKLDGTVLYNFSDTGAMAPIAVDIDKNKALDVVWYKKNKIILLLDNSTFKNDLSVEEKDISFSPLNSTSAIVSANVHNNGGLNLDNARVKLTNAETLESANGIISIKGNNVNNFTAVLNLKNHDKVLAKVNYDDSIEESNDENNFASREYMGLPYVFVSADLLEPSNIGSEFKDYIKNKLASGYYTENENEANVKVYIGKFAPRNQANNIKTLNDFKFGYDSGNIIYYDKTGTSPYSALIGAFKDSNGKTIVMIAGNEIEGNIAGAKEFIKNQALFLSTQEKNSIFVNDENPDAIKIFDYLHLGGNVEHYLSNNNEFRQIVRNALNDEMFSVFDKSVVTNNGITLRLRNLRANFSSDYLEYLNSSGVPVGMPVVLARGLWSNLTSWETFAGELANTGRDAWLIEITGGPNQDCDNCIDYTFDDLTDSFVPTLLNGVLNFTNKNKLQYVGFSNGCRATLSSLEKGKFDSNKVETFVAVGCPGAFNHSENKTSISPVSDLLNAFGENTLKNLKAKNKRHITIFDIINEIPTMPQFSDGGLKISINLFEQYFNWSSQTTDNQPGKGVNVNKFLIIRGDLYSESDGVVSTFDQSEIFKNVNAGKKTYMTLSAGHFGIIFPNIADRKRTKSLITKTLNNESLSSLEKAIYILDSKP